MEFIVPGLGSLKPNKTHEAQGSKPLVGQNYETDEVYKKYDVNGATNNWEYDTNSLSTLPQSMTTNQEYWSLPARAVGEFTGTAIKVAMDCIVFIAIYNSTAPVAPGLLSGQIAAYGLYVLSCFVVGAVTHADFFSDSCKFDPFISFWSLFVANSRYMGTWFAVWRFFTEIIFQFLGCLLGAAVAFYTQPVSLQRTYLTGGIPFYDRDITTRNTAIGLQIFAYIFISYTFARIQYGVDRNTRMESKSMLMGAAYAGAAAVTYYTGGCTSFLRWLGTAIVTGVYNVQTDVDTAGDAAADNVFSEGWVYLVAPLIGCALGILILYTIVLRPQRGTQSPFNYVKKKV